MFAEIAVHTPMARRLQGDGEPADAPSLGLTFHYAIPPELAETLQVGHLVWVPFGSQELHGVVLGFTDALPSSVQQARPLIDLVMPAPVCTPAQLDLARWLSRHYLAPILDCVLLTLPPGLIQKAEPVLALTAIARQALEGKAPALNRLQPPGGEPQQMSFASHDFDAALHQGPYFPQFPDLNPDQHGLLAWLQEHDQVTERVLLREAPHLARRGVYYPLMQRGLVNRQRRIMETPIQPKTGKQVALIANQETVDQVLPTLGRSSKQADALAWLAASRDPAPTLADVCEAADCSPAPLRSLADRGWTEMLEARRWLDLAVPPAEVDEVLAGELQRAPVQSEALAVLRDATVAGGGPVDEDALREQHGISAGTLAALEGRDLVRRTADPPRVRLVLPRDQVPQHLIQLRGGEKYLPVLEALAGETGPVWLGWLYAETGTNLNTLRDLAAAGLISLTETQVWRDPLAGKAFVADKAPALTADQAGVWREIERGIGGWKPEDGGQSAEDAREGNRPPVYLLHGVTGSGKTEIYLRAIGAALEAGRQAIALVPEIALTPQTVRRFAARFGERVTIYHSDLSPGERYDVWRRARAGQVDVVVGTRSALFLPLPHLGLIVLDEEHDPSYKESQRAPRYHARDAAVHLARLTGSAVILGSATPSLESYHAAQLGRVHLLELPRRIMGHAQAIAEQQRRLHLAKTVYRPVDAWTQDARYTELPPVQVVDLRQELRAGNRSMFSRALQAAMDRVLEAGQQAILFLNRRGSATFVMCRDCGHVLTCEHCDVPLTYHEGRGRAQPEIVCHHCGRREPSPERCPECGSRRIRYLGTGTEKIAEAVSTAWPAARVVRWDRDVTGRKGSHDAILDRFASGRANVMVGTQMIAKGLDLPLVTLVGVISADVGLYLPDFRAAERNFQLLTQVAGRAGRSLLGGQVIIQSYKPEHYAIQAARRHDYRDFVRQEMSYRRQLGYPPFRRLAKLVYVHADKNRAQQEAEALARGLSFSIHDRGLAGVDLIGPAPCFFGRERRKYRWQIIVRAVDPVAFLRPLELPQGWRVDVDPASTL